MATRRLAALLALAALAPAGCGGEDEGGDAVEGDGYSYSVPDGWEDASDRRQDVPELGRVELDTLVIGEREDDFTTNVNVVREGGVPEAVTAAEYAEVSLAGLRDPAAAGLPPGLAKELESLDPARLSEARDLELGGEEAVAWDFEATQEGRRVRIRQLVAVTDGAGYTVSLTVLPGRFEEATGALDEVIESWRWE
jgi:hypothetical protein